MHTYWIPNALNSGPEKVPQFFCWRTAAFFCLKTVQKPQLRQMLYKIVFASQIGPIPPFCLLEKHDLIGKVLPVQREEKKGNRTCLRGAGRNGKNTPRSGYWICWAGKGTWLAWIVENLLPWSMLLELHVPIKAPAASPNIFCLVSSYKLWKNSDSHQLR